MAVIDYLTGLRSRSAYAHAVHDVVETLFEQREHVLAHDALHALGALVVAVELAFEQTVDTAHLLLLAELDAVLGILMTGEAVLSGRSGTSVERALLALGGATVAFEI